MSIAGVRKAFECVKVFTFIIRFWKKKLTMIFKPMVSLCIVICHYAYEVCYFKYMSQSIKEWAK